jgi:hypothetical protein
MRHSAQDAKCAAIVLCVKVQSQRPTRHPRNLRALEEFSRIKSLEPSKASAGRRDD